MPSTPRRESKPIQTRIFHYDRNSWVELLTGTFTINRNKMVV
jgi:hypothetical protein